VFNLGWHDGITQWRIDPLVNTDRKMDNDCPANTILIIDDRNEIRAHLTLLLSMEGYRVSAARNGQEGLALAQKGNPGLVFVDLGLPDISGWDVAQKIKRANGQAKIIIMTGSIHALSRVEAGERSVDFTLLKPFGFDDVLDALALLSARE
jgi:DNA-binding response OmpR family regulator